MSSDPLDEAPGKTLALALASAHEAGASAIVTAILGRLHPDEVQEVLAYLEDAVTKQLVLDPGEDLVATSQHLVNRDPHEDGTVTLRLVGYGVTRRGAPTPLRTVAETTVPIRSGGEPGTYQVEASAAQALVTEHVGEGYSVCWLGKGWRVEYVALLFLGTS